MNPFMLGEAVRRARRRRVGTATRPSHRAPTWRLAADELALLLRALVAAPATAVVLAGAVTAAGVSFAVGPGYPGPVAPTAARVLLVGLVVVASIGLARTAPPRWSLVRRAVRRTRLGLAIALLAALVTIVKVGLHELTPGPALAAPWRWGAVVVGCTVAALAVLAGNGEEPGPR